MLRFLFVQAMQPYLRHMHVWAFTTHVSLDVAESCGCCWLLLSLCRAMAGLSMWQLPL